MKRLVLITALLMTFGLAGRAQCNYLHVATDKGWEVIDLDKADRITFHGGTMTVSDAAGNPIASYPQASLDRMYVDQNTGVDQISSDTSCATFRLNGNGRTVELLGTGVFEVFGLDGTRLVEIPEATAGKTVDLTGLKPGVYVYRLGGYSVKGSIN